MSSKNERLAWKGTFLKVPETNTKLPEHLRKEIIEGQDGKRYGVGASVNIVFDDDLETKA